MQKTFFPVMLHHDSKLPIYITSAGINYNQEMVTRDRGYRDYHWIQCNDGKGELIINNEKLVFEKNMGIIIPKGVPHTYSPLTPIWLTDWFTFNGFAVHQLLESLGFYKPILYPLSDAITIRKQLEKCIEIGNTSTNHRALSVLSYELVMTLDSFISKKSGSDQNEKIDLIIEYINKHYQEVITIDQLAEIVTITPQYFCKIFKEATNKRPFEYINTVRIQKSKELMLNTNMTIHTISKIVGFENPSYYGKWFKQIESTTPGEFRRHYRG